MNLHVNDEQLDTMLHAAVLTALGEDAKQLIVTQVVAYLTKESEPAYNGRRSPSPLREAMNIAASRYASKFVEEKLATDVEFQEQLAKLYTEALAKVFADPERIKDRMASALSSALTGDRY